MAGRNIFLRCASCYYNSVSVNYSPFSRHFLHNQALFKHILHQSRSITNSNHTTKIPENKEKEVIIQGDGTWQEIYHGILSTQIKLVKTFSLSTSILCLCVQPLMLQKLMGSNVGLAVSLGTVIGFFTFITPILIHWITKKYVTRLEYNPVTDLYSATTISFFLREKKTEFQADEVLVPEIPGMFTSFIARKSALFVQADLFDNLDHYSRLMGLDKPINYYMPEDRNEKKSD